MPIPCKYGAFSRLSVSCPRYAVARIDGQALCEPHMLLLYPEVEHQGLPDGASVVGE